MHVLGDPFPISSTNCELEMTQNIFFHHREKKIYFLFIVYLMMERNADPLIQGI